MQGRHLLALTVRADAPANFQDLARCHIGSGRGILQVYIGGGVSAPASAATRALLAPAVLVAHWAAVRIPTIDATRRPHVGSPRRAPRVERRVCASGSRVSRARTFGVGAQVTSLRNCRLVSCDLRLVGEVHNPCVEARCAPAAGAVVARVKPRRRVLHGAVGGGESYRSSEQEGAQGAYHLTPPPPERHRESTC